MELKSPQVQPGASRTTAAPISLQENTLALLDLVLRHAGAGRMDEAMRLMSQPLSALWSEARGSARAAEMQRWCREHELYPLLQQDPFTARCTRKPRGYAGDAVMMDYIYGNQAPEGTTALGAAIFAASTRVPMGLSVRFRRQLLKSLIDDAVAQRADARILSVASGHARELEGSLIEQPGFAGEVVAFDQDTLSCAEVARVHAGRPVRVVNRGVRELMSGAESRELAASLGRFDLVYSAGLFDYLPDTMAKRLTQRLFALLRPGGRLVIGNFVPGSANRGFMELFADWVLVLRDEEQMRELARAAGAARFTSFLDPHRNVAYIELHAPA